MKRLEFYLDKNGKITVKEIGNLTTLDFYKIREAARKLSEELQKKLEISSTNK